jgi:hypothetical protein
VEVDLPQSLSVQVQASGSCLGSMGLKKKKTGQKLKKKKKKQ